MFVYKANDLWLRFVLKFVFIVGTIYIQYKTLSAVLDKFAVIGIVHQLDARVHFFFNSSFIFLFHYFIEVFFFISVIRSAFSLTPKKKLE